MEILWCWRCKMELGMLNEEEFKIASQLYNDCMRISNSSATDMKSRFKPLLDYYNSITGEEETNPDAIMHHRISQYGPPCENCGKPYRTPQASFCAACGNKRS
jgi:hypothetical protein